MTASVKKIFLLLGVIFGLWLNAGAERSLTLSLRETPASGIDLGDWNDAKVTSSSGILLEAEYTLDPSVSQRYLGAYFNPNQALMALAKMEVFGFGAQLLYGPLRGGGKVPYIVMSTDYRNASGMQVGSMGPSKIVFDLADSQEGWNLKAIGLEVVNYDRYRNFINSGATGILKINGHEVQAPDNAAPAEVRVDLSADGPVKQITIETDADASVGFRAITLYPGGEPEFVELDDERASTPDYSPDGSYRLPYMAVGAVDSPDVLTCAIFDASGRKVNVTALPDAHSPYFSVTPAEGDGEIMEEGYYRAVYYLEDGNYVPQAEDGAEFAILPSARGLYLNWKEIDVYSSRIWEVPSHTVHTDASGNTTQYDWEHVLTNGFRPGTTVYWKVSGEPDTGYHPYAMPPKSGAAILRAVGPSAEIPEGYQRLQNQSVDLSKGSRLSLILQRNGVTSYPFNIDYTRVDIPTSITEMMSDAEDVIFTEYFDLTGRRVSLSDALPGQLLLKVDHLNDGIIRSAKHRTY